MVNDNPASPATLGTPACVSPLPDIAQVRLLFDGTGLNEIDEGALQETLGGLGHVSNLVRMPGFLEVTCATPALSSLRRAAENAQVRTQRQPGATLREMWRSDECLYDRIPPVQFGKPQIRSLGSQDIIAAASSADILLVSATDVERQAIHDVLKPLDGQALVRGPIGSLTVVVGRFGACTAAYVICDMGSQAPNAATLTTYEAIQLLRPKAVFVLGIAFGADRRKTRLGDVLVADRIAPYELARIKAGQTIQRGAELPTSPLLKERFRAYEDTWELLRESSRVQVHHGLVLSGEKVIDDAEFLENLQHAYPTAIGGEMEGTGAYSAAAKSVPQVPILLVKSVCDFADGFKNSRAQPFAARAAVSFCEHILSQPDVLTVLPKPAGTASAVPGTLGRTSAERNSSGSDVAIQNSVVVGDVVTGDKHVHIHALQPLSEALLVAEFGQQGGLGSGVDKLINELLESDAFLTKFDSLRSAKSEKDVDEMVRKTLADCERLGPSSATFADLERLAEKQRRHGTEVAFAKAAILLLQLYDTDLSKAEKGHALAEELIRVLDGKQTIRRYIALARAYQARHFFFRYTDEFLRLKTALAARSTLEVQLPPEGLTAKHRTIQSHWQAADSHLKEAIEIALNSGDVHVAISVLFQAEQIQEHAYFFARHVILSDGANEIARVENILRLLGNMTGQLGDEKEQALVVLNEANFRLRREEFERAAELSMKAAQALTQLGQPYYASKALEILRAANAHEPPVPPPPSQSPEELLQAMSGPEYVEFVQEISRRQLELAGHDLHRDPELRKLVEQAWKDLNPDRVMRFCEHLKLGCATSLLGEAIALPTLGFKRVGCAKSGAAIEGVSLDDAFALFKEQQCDSCIGRTPRPDGWAWRPGMELGKPNM